NVVGLAVGRSAAHLLLRANGEDLARVAVGSARPCDAHFAATVAVRGARGAVVMAFRGYALALGVGVAVIGATIAIAAATLARRDARRTRFVVEAMAGAARAIIRPAPLPVRGARIRAPACAGPVVLALPDLKGTLTAIAVGMASIPEPRAMRDG